MNSTKLLAHLLAIAQHSSEIRRELQRGDAARAMVEAHAGRLLKTAARLYAEAAAIEPDKPTWWAAALNRRAEVEQTLLDVAHGKRPLPDAETCRALALRLGVPEEFAKETR